MGSGLCSAFVGLSQAILYNSAQVSAGQSFIFNSIIAVVIGGVLLTGGYGSVVGIVLGTLTFSIVNQGIYYTGFDANWASLIIGILLLAAVLMNNTFRNMAMTLRPAHEGEGPVMTTPLLKLTGINKSFGPIDVLHDISLDVQRGRGAVPARRQWRRQVDADQDPLGRPQADLGHGSRWTASPSRSTARATPAIMASRPSTSSAGHSR